MNQEIAFEKFCKEINFTPSSEFKRVYNKKTWLEISVILISVIIILISQYFASNYLNNNI